MQTVRSNKSLLQKRGRQTTGQAEVSNPEQSPKRTEWQAVSRWYKGIGRQVLECVIRVFIYPNYSVPCKGTGTKTKQTHIQNTG